MLGLADEVGRDDMRVRRPVGEDQAVGRACDHVDADPAEKDALGFGHELVAGADEDLGLGQPEQAEGHRRDALHPAHGHDLVGAADMGGIDDGGCHADIGARRRTGGDVLAARDLGCGHGHDRAGDMAVSPTRHITPRRIDRDRLLPGDEARHDLVFDIGHGGFLLLGKAAHIVVAELDVALQLFGHQRAGGFDLVRRQDDIAVVFVELGGIFQRLRIAARLDIVKDRTCTIFLVSEASDLLRSGSLF